MNKSSRFSTILAFFMMFSVVFQATALAEELTATPQSSGTLVVLLVDDGGTPLDGCVHVSGSGSFAADGCADGSGMVTFADVPAGDTYWVTQTRIADGYYPAVDDSFVMVDGGQAQMTMTSTPVPVPTEEPVVEPTVAPTEEPTAEPTEEATEVPTEEPASTPAKRPTRTSSLNSDFSPMATTIEDARVYCEPWDFNQGADITVYVAASEEFTPAPTFRYKETDRFGKVSETDGQTMVWNAGNGRYEYLVYADPNRTVEFWVKVEGKPEANLSANCAQFNPIPLEIQTVAKDENGTDLLPSGVRINPGTPFGDTATFVSGEPDAFALYGYGLEGQTVTYKLYKDAVDCSGTPVAEFEVTLGADGAIPDSWSQGNGFFTPTEEGVYDWQVVYPGDPGNFQAAASECGTETVVVAKAQVTVKTVMQTGDGATDIAQNGTVPFGTSVRDTTILHGATADAGGQVTYTLYRGANCEEQIGDPETVTVRNGTVPPSSPRTINEQGTYNWVVTYTGDANNAVAEGGQSGCGEETFVVGKFQPTVTTVMMEAGKADPIGQGGEVSLGASVYDTAEMEGVFPDSTPTGNVTYTLYYGSCPDGEIVGTPVTLDLNEDGTLPNSPPLTVDKVGTYNWVVEYSGDDYNAPARSWCGEETFNVVKNQPTITTEHQVRTGDTFENIGNDGVLNAPADVRDTAEIEGLTEGASGQVIYYLYQGATCAGEPFAGPFPVDLGQDGTVQPSPVVEGLEPGRYNWVAVYTGDPTNNEANSGCWNEQFFVTAGEGVGGYVDTIVINDNTGDEVPNGGRVELGTTVYDTARFYGNIVDDQGNATVGGTLTYTLYEGDTCSGDPLGSWPVTVTEGQPVPPMTDAENGTYQFKNAGIYNFQATFTYGEGEDQVSISSPCNTERVEVDKAGVTIVTVISAGATEDALTELSEANPRLTRPVWVKDGVTFTTSPANLPEDIAGPSGTLTYELHNTSGCDGTAVETWEKTVTDGVFPDSDPWQLTDADYGVYNWKVTFTADEEGNYTGALSDCGKETFYVDAQPTLDTTMFWSADGEGTGTELGNGSTVEVGQFVRDTATLSGTTMEGGTSNAGGTVTFTLHRGHDCTGAPVQEFSSVPVVDGVASMADWYELTLFGEYSWKASYSGDIAQGGFNKPIDAHCENENFTVPQADGGPTMETVMWNVTADTVIPHGSYVSLPASVADDAIFTNLSNEATGTVTYELYNNAECAGDAVFTSEKGVVDGVAERSGEYELPRVSGVNSRVYSWKVTFEGTGTFEGVSAESGCGEEQFRLFNSGIFSASTVCSYDSEANTMSFTIYLNPRDVNDENFTPYTLTLQPYHNDLSADDPITFTQADTTNWVFDYPDSEWRRVDGRVDWVGPNGPSWATFSVSCNTSTFNPEITTKMFVGGQADELENESEVKPGTAIYDTTQMTNSTVIVSGTLTYKLYRGPIDPVCEVANAELISTETIDLGSGETIDDYTDRDDLPDSAPVTINDPGTYFWVVEFEPPADDPYSGNNAAVSDCNTETFTVLPFTETTLTTVIVTENGDPTLAAIGEGFHDTATLTWEPNVTPEFVVPTGTVTYNLYAGQGQDACGGDPVWTSDELDLNEDGTFPTSGITSFTDFDDVGHYEFQAVFESDNEAHFASATSECGTEPLEITTPDVAITKSVNDTELNAADDIVFTLEIKNIGDVLAFGVVVMDDLPLADELEWTIGGNAANTCTIDENGVLTCDIGTMAAGATHTVTLTAKTTAETTCGLVENVASVEASNEPEDEESQSNNRDEASTTVRCPDVAIEKSVDLDTVNAGEVLTYTLLITNIGDGDAYNTTVTDELPEGPAWAIDAANSAEGCEIVDGVLTCDFGTLEPGTANAKTVTLAATTSHETTCGEIKNTSTVESSNESTTRTENNTSTATATVNCADIEVAKIADDASVSAGDQIGFTITVTNSGDGVAKGVTLTDELPDAVGLDWGFGPDSGEGCAIEDGVLTCDFGDMEPEAERSVHIVSLTTVDTCGEIDNTAIVSGGNFDDEEDSDTTEVLCPDIAVTKTAGSGVISAGEAISFDITVTNNGGGIARNVTLTDDLPAGFAWTIDPAHDACGIEDGVLDCDFGDMEPDATITVTVTAPTNAELCGEVENTAYAEADNENPDGDNEDGDTVVIQCPDVWVVKTADAGEVNATDGIGFTITFGNTGPGTAFNVELTDRLPTGTGLGWTIDEENSDDVCAIVDGVLTCEFEELAAGASHAVHITSLTSAETTCGAIDNTAVIKASNEPRDEEAQDDNESSASTRVRCPDVEIEKTTETGTVNATDDIVFDIEIRNSGAGAAYGVVVKDTLPEGLSWAIDGGTIAEDCTIVDGILTCEFDEMPVGASGTVSVRAATSFETCGIYPNTAEISAENESDTRTENNTSTATATVNCADIEVAKIADDASVSAGDQIGFTITVTNSGDGVAKGVTLTDDLPAAADLDWTIDPANEDCAIEDGVLTCDFGDMEPEAERSVHIVSPTTADTCGVIDNTALVESENHPDAPTSGQTVVKCPNIVVAKTAGSGVISAGEAISFDITVTNNGGGIARNVTLTDDLPADFSWTIDPAHDACGIEDGVLDCDFGDMEPDATITVTVTAPTTAEQCGEVENVARADADNEREENTGDNEDGDTVTILCPNTSILKTTTTPSVSAGEDISFTIEFTNAGPGKAFDVEITDDLPTDAGLDWRLDPAHEACDIEDGVLDCDLGTVEAETTITLTLVSPTTAESCGDIENVISATASNDDPSSDDANVEVLCPDVEIEKTAENGVVSAGEQIAFTITLTNNGPGKAFDATLTDTLPDAAGLAWTIDPANEACDIEDGVLDCDFGTIEAETSVEVRLASSTTGQTCSTIENVASASFSNDDPVENGDEVEVLCPDVGIEKVADDEAVNATDSIGFTMRFANAGPGTAFDVVVTDQLPVAPGLAWTIDGGDDADLCAIDEDGVLTCEIGTVEPEAAFEIHIVSPTTAETTCGAIDNTAMIEASNEPRDEETQDDSESTASTTVRCPDVAVEKVADEAAVSAGEAIGFTLTVTNLGNGTSYDTVLTDTLPDTAGLDWAIDPAVDGCAIVDGVLTCDLGDLEAGASISVHITSPTTKQTCSEIENTVAVESANEAEAATGNNTSSARVTVSCSGIILTKTADAGEVQAGEQIGFTISLTNNGEGAAFDTVLTDKLSAAPGLAWTIDGGTAAETCAIVDGVLTCDIGTLEAGATVDVHISSPTTVEGCQVVENTASAEFSNADPVDSTDRTTVTCPDPEVPADPADPITTLPTTGAGGSPLATTGLAMLLLATLAAISAAVAAWLRREGAR